MKLLNLFDKKGKIIFYYNDYYPLLSISSSVELIHRDNDTVIFKKSVYSGELDQFKLIIINQSRYFCVYLVIRNANESSACAQ